MHRSISCCPNRKSSSFLKSIKKVPCSDVPTGSPNWLFFLSFSLNRVLPIFFLRYWKLGNKWLQTEEILLPFLEPYFVYLRIKLSINKIALFNTLNSFINITHPIHQLQTIFHLFLPPSPCPPPQQLLHHRLWSSTPADRSLSCLMFF